MTDKFDMRIDGLKELNDLLVKLPQNVENRVLQKAVNGALKVAFSDIQRKAPKHLTNEQSENSRRYGSILANLRFKVSKKARGFRSAKIDTGNSFWAFFYEKGSRNQPARPWFDPAFKAAAQKILTRLEELLDKGIQEEAKKLENDRKNR